MKLKNYSTKISVEKTVGEIQAMLAARGVNSVRLDYQNGRPFALSFTLDVKSRPVRFQLPARWTAVYRILEKDQSIPKGLRTRDQAMRVGWRIVKSWLEAQLAIVDVGMADMAEVFLPYAVSEEHGRTLYQLHFESGGVLHPGGDSDVEWGHG